MNILFDVLHFSVLKFSFFVVHISLQRTFIGPFKSAHLSLFFFKAIFFSFFLFKVLLGEENGIFCLFVWSPISRRQIERQLRLPAFEPGAKARNSLGTDFGLGNHSSVFAPAALKCNYLQ